MHDAPDQRRFQINADLRHALAGLIQAQIRHQPFLLGVLLLELLQPTDLDHAMGRGQNRPQSP
jgi:hypothetical protein